MSVVLRVALVALVSMAFASNAMARKVQSDQMRLKPFTVAEKAQFDRASMNGDPAGGGDGGGSAN